MVYYSHLIGAMSTAVAISGHYYDLFKVWNFCNWVKGTNKLFSLNYDPQLLDPYLHAPFSQKNNTLKC